MIYLYIVYFASRKSHNPRQCLMLDLLWAKGLFMGYVASVGIITGQVWQLSGIANDYRLDTVELCS